MSAMRCMTGMITVTGTTTVEAVSSLYLVSTATTAITTITMMAIAIAFIVAAIIGLSATSDNSFRKPRPYLRRGFFLCAHTQRYPVSEQVRVWISPSVGPTRDDLGCDDAERDAIATASEHRVAVRQIFELREIGKTGWAIRKGARPRVVDFRGRGQAAARATFRAAVGSFWNGCLPAVCVVQARVFALRQGCGCLLSCACRGRGRMLPRPDIGSAKTPSPGWASWPSPRLR